MPDGLLSQEHEAALAAAKQKLREENEEYIRQHPELRGAIRLLMAKLLDLPLEVRVREKLADVLLQIVGRVVE